MLTNRRARATAAVIATLTIVFTNPAPASADTVAYLFNVEVRPGYHFAGPDDALRYGHGLCDDVRANHVFSEVVAKVKSDMQTTEEYQASYLISQAINELCPDQIWQLRQSAAGYRPTSG